MNSIKIHISDVKNSRLRQDLPISINDRVILPFPEGFIFTKLHENKVLSKIFEFTVDSGYLVCNSSYSFMLIVLKLYRCFGHGLKMCMFGHQL